MSTNHDVEAANGSNKEYGYDSQPKLFVGTGTSPSNEKKSDGKNSSWENRLEEHNMYPLDQPSAPLLKKQLNHGKLPLAESEVDDLDSPSLNGLPMLRRESLKHEDDEKRLGADEVDTVTRLGGSADGVSEGGTAHARDEEDDINGPHYGIENRFGERPMSAMELEQRIIPDVNVYQQKKNLAQGMMDLALLSANANQLRYVIESSNSHPYYWPSLIFISLSIIFQILVGIGLIMNSAYNVKNEDDICKADKINNLTIIGIFLVTIVNVFITAFSVAERGSVPGIK